MEYLKDERNEAVWLKNFGEVGVISQQQNLFVKPDLMQRQKNKKKKLKFWKIFFKKRYEKAFSRILNKYGDERIRSMKKSHLYEQSKGNFSDHKAIKVF